MIELCILYLQVPDSVEQVPSHYDNALNNAKVRSGFVCLYDCNCIFNRKYYYRCIFARSPDAHTVFETAVFNDISTVGGCFSKDLFGDSPFMNV